MMKAYSFRKKIFTVAVTLTTASVYFAQTSDTLRTDSTIEEVVITGVADIAKDRKTPVAVSTIKEAQIVEKLGNQEFPEILNTTPSVYATKSGGGFGDGKTVIRGFSQENVAVMINGVPVNDMENGAVYWSNWSGLSDVTSSLQVQRGLGSSKLAIASVGGTMNMLTRAADKKRGALVAVSVGNDDYHKSLFSYNSGKNANGWATSFLMSRTAGSMYADGTEFEGYNYYWALGYQPSAKHEFQFTITGAPQQHNQRSTAVPISTYLDMQDGKLDKVLGDEPNRRYNADWGWMNGEVLSNRVNYYHKPVMSLNWDWNISPNSKLNSVFYASFGRGGGTGDLGRVGNKFVSGYVTPEGQIDYPTIFAANAAVNVNTAAASSTLVRRASVNSHNWFGAILSFNHKLTDNLNFTIGTDDRYYYGYHYQVLSHLYGASGYKDVTNKNFYTTGPNNTYVATPRIVTNVFDPKPDWNPFGGKINDRGDMVAYNNDGEVLWYGGFGQLEYSDSRVSAFVSGALSNQSFQRIDHFVLDGQTLLNGQTAGFNVGNTVIQPTDSNPALHTKTGFKDIFGYNIKAGANFNLNENHNIFGNIGYYSKQPFLNAVYPNNKNYLNPNLTNEKIFGVEAGYGFRSGSFNANVNLYRTSWKDRFLRRSLTIDPDNNPATNNSFAAYSNIEGITEIHQGVEVDANYRLANILTLNAMFSYGDYHYDGNATGRLFDESNQPIEVSGNNSATTLYLDNVKVGGSAQTTAALGATLEPVKNFKVDATYRYADKLYANLNLLNFLTEQAGKRGAMELPSFGLLDVGMSFKIPLNNPAQYFTLRGNVYNVLDKTYIAESNTNVRADLTQDDFKKKDAAGNDVPDVAAFNTYNAIPLYDGVKQNNQVFFGYGRTWSATLSFNF